MIKATIGNKLLIWNGGLSIVLFEENISSPSQSLLLSFQSRWLSSSFYVRKYIKPPASRSLRETRASPTWFDTGMSASHSRQPPFKFWTYFISPRCVTNQTTTLTKRQSIFLANVAKKPLSTKKENVAPAFKRRQKEEGNVCILSTCYGVATPIAKIWILFVKRNWTVSKDLICTCVKMLIMQRKGGKRGKSARTRKSLEEVLVANASFKRQDSAVKVLSMSSKWKSENVQLQHN